MENLSDPQELQDAINSHKRDRRQSDTVEFMHTPLATGCRGTLEQFTPVTNTITATQGLQILNSPTMALPHGAIPPYSGSFIVTGPGGTQMVTPQISGGPPQLVQMTTTPHGIPIMVPALAGSGAKHDLGQGVIAPSVDQDCDDVSSQASSDMSDRESSAPPPKRIALDRDRGSVVMTTRIPSISAATATGFMMTPTRHMVPTSHFTSPLPHVLHMASPNTHIPVVMPTTTATGFITQTTSPIETQVSNGGIIIKGDDSLPLRRYPLENGLSSPHFISGGSSKRTQVISASHLLRMTQQQSHPLPTTIPINTCIAGHHGNKHHTSESPSSPDKTHPSSSTATTVDKSHSKYNGGVNIPPSSGHSGISSLKMPFANIAIQSG